MAAPETPPPARPRRSDPRGASSGADASPNPEPVRHQLYLHLAWTTLDGLPLVGPRQALALEGHLIALCRRLDVEPVEAAADADRVHLLLRLKPVHAVDAVARRLKRGSTEAMLRRREPVRWGRGWAAATVAPDDVRRTRRILRGKSLVVRQLTPGLRAP